MILCPPRMVSMTPPSQIWHLVWGNQLWKDIALFQLSAFSASQFLLSHRSSVTCVVLGLWEKRWRHGAVESLRAEMALVLGCELGTGLAGKESASFHGRQAVKVRLLCLMCPQPAGWETKAGGGEVPFCSELTKRPVFLPFSMVLPGTFECYLERTENRWQASKGTWYTLSHTHIIFLWIYHLISD